MDAEDCMGMGMSSNGMQEGGEGDSGYEKMAILQRFVVCGSPFYLGPK